MSKEEVKWRFGVVGNIVGKHTGEDGNTYYGTKAFKPGTKVYIDGKYWNRELTSVSVIGLNRFGRLVLDHVPIYLIENYRTQRIYKPHVLKIIDYITTFEGWDWWGRTTADRKGTESFVKAVGQMKNVRRDNFELDPIDIETIVDYKYVRPCTDNLDAYIEELKKENFTMEQIEYLESTCSFDIWEEERKGIDLWYYLELFYWAMAYGIKTQPEEYPENVRHLDMWNREKYDIAYKGWAIVLMIKATGEEIILSNYGPKDK